MQALSNAFTGSIPGSPQPQLQLSRSITGQLLGDELDTGGPGYESLRSQANPVENRQRFERNRRDIVRGIVEGSPRIFCLVCVLMLSILLFNWGLAICGWVYYVKYGRDECDRPLATWLLLRLCQQVSVIVLNRIFDTLNRYDYLSLQAKKVLKAFVILLPVAVLCLGFFWFFQSETCSETNPSLYTFVRFYLIASLLNLIFLFLISFAVLGVLIYGFTHGWFDKHVEAADPRTIESLRVVDYQPGMFAEEGKTDDDRPAGECCCCTEPFGPSQKITLTPCNHYFHKGCLGEWLKRSKKCPLCRVDLEEAVNQKEGTPDLP